MEVEQDNSWRDYQISYAEAGLVAMENLLDDGDRDDAVYVLGKIVSILGQVYISGDEAEEASSLLDEAQEKLESALSLVGGAE